MDSVETSASEDSLLIYNDSQALHSFLAKYSKLSDPFDAVMCSHIDSYLSNIPFLEGIKSSKLCVLAAMCRYEAFDTDQVIFEENDPGDKLYIILNGSATVSVNATQRPGGNSPEGKRRSLLLEASGGFTGHNGVDQRIVVANLSSGDYFGETSILIDVNRTSTVKTNEKSLFVTVEKKMFDNFCAVCPLKDSMRRVMADRMLSKLSSLRIPFLEGISKESFKSLQDQVEIHEPKDGEVIFNEGDVGDRFYIIVHGQAKVEFLAASSAINKGKNENTDQVAQEDKDVEDKVVEEGTKKSLRVEYLHHGSYFGEMALVNDNPRSATVAAVGKTILLSIGKESFLKIFGSSKNALAEFNLRLLRSSSELKHLLAHSFGKSMFRHYLQKNFADENIDFWVDANEFKETYSGSMVEISGSDSDRGKDDIESSAKDIFDKYCHEDAERQVNLPHAIRSSIENSIKEGEVSESLFDVAIHEIYNLMVRDNYLRFKKTPDFLEFFKCLGLIDV